MQFPRAMRDLLPAEESLQFRPRNEDVTVFFKSNPFDCVDYAIKVSFVILSFLLLSNLS